MVAFSVLATIAFVLFFIALICRTHLKGERCCCFELGSDNFSAFLITVGLICLVVAVWVFM